MCDGQLLEKQEIDRKVSEYLTLPFLPPNNFKIMVDTSPPLLFKVNMMSSALYDIVHPSPILLLIWKWLQTTMANAMKKISPELHFKLFRMQATPCVIWGYQSFLLRWGIISMPLDTLSFQLGFRRWTSLLIFHDMRGNKTNVRSCWFSWCAMRALLISNTSRALLASIHDESYSV